MDVTVSILLFFRIDQSIRVVYIEDFMTIYMIYGLNKGIQFAGYKYVVNVSYLFVGFEHGTFEHIRGAISRDITENLQVLRIVRYVEYPIDGVVE